MGPWSGRPTAPPSWGKPTPSWSFRGGRKTAATAAPATTSTSTGTSTSTSTAAKGNLLDPGFELTLRPMRYPGFYDRYRDVAPKVVRKDDGSDVWTFNGQTIPNIGLNAVAGRPKEEYGIEPTAFDEMRPGCWDVDEEGRPGALYQMLWAHPRVS